MDTREKICSVDGFTASHATEAWTVVIGVFDPITVEVVRDIAALAIDGRKLLVVVVETLDDGAGGQGSATLLGAEARARILASLRVVDAVVIASSAAAKDAFRLANIDVRVEEDPAADRRRSEQFVQHVLDRQASAAGQET